MSTKRKHSGSQGGRETKRSRRTTKKVSTAVGVHRAVRTKDYIIPISDATEYHSYLGASLNSLDGYAEFSNLYESYRIYGVRATFIYDRNSSDSNSGVAYSNLPMLYTYDNPVDYVAAATNEAAEQHGTYQVHRLDQPVVKYYKPKAAGALYGGAFTSYGQTSPWIDTTSPAVQYYFANYGVLFNVYSPGDPHTTGRMRVFLKYYIEFKGLK